MRIGFVGLGNMGGRIAKRLIQQGRNLSVYDVNADVITEFANLGAVAAPTLMDLTHSSDAIITVLPNASIVREVVLGDQGLYDGFRPGCVLIDMTSSIPAVTKEIGAVLKEKEVYMLDAPVSGGVKKAEIGELSIMVGGDESVFRRMVPLLMEIGTNVAHVGALGAGHSVKALNNLLCAATLGITSEALAIGTKMGLDPAKILGVINSSSGRSHSSEVKFPQQVLSRKFEVGFTVDLMKKDVDIALSLAENEQIPAPIAKAVSALWTQAVDKGFGGMDHTAIAKFVEERSGVEIK